MPKKYGIKEKDLVVSHVVNLVLTGKLRSGDRVDRNEIAQELGVSRVPIQEAVVQLEHDGILSTQYHRGAYVETFDASVVREHLEIYGLLMGVASARAATDPEARVLGQLESILEYMRNNREARAFQDAAWDFRAAINDTYCGPRLKAMITASHAFNPRDFWATYLHSYEEMLSHYELEVDAIRRRDPDGARNACAMRAAFMSRILLGELVRRGVLSPQESPALHSE